MPTSFAVRFRVEQTGRAHPRHLRALVTSLLEDGVGAREHHRNVKPFTVHPPVTTDDGFALVIAALEPQTAERLERACVLQQRRLLRFGEMHVRLASPYLETLRSERFESIIEQASDHDTVAIQLRSPTVFRSGRRGMLPKPVPTQVFGHYRARWNHFAPAEIACDLAFDDLGLEVDVIEGATVAYRDGHRRGGRLVELEFPGFVGTVRYRPTGTGASDVARRWLHALAWFGQYCGTGANTTIGMGATHYLGARGVPGAPEWRNDETKVN